MINTSEEYKQVIQKGGRSIYSDIKIKLCSGEVLDIPQKIIRALLIEDDVSGKSTFDIGSAIINQCTLKFDNTDGQYTDKEFDQAEISVKIGLQLSKTEEWLNKGTFNADPGDENGNVITVKAYDNMRKFDRPYSESKLDYPATLDQIVRDACDVCGVLYVSPSTSEFDYVVQEKPNDESLTFREVLSWVGQITCRWFRCNTNGALTSGFYDIEAYEQNDSAAFHHIENLMVFSKSTEDIIITGISIEQEKDYESTTYLSGEEGYVLGIKGNQLINDGEGETIASQLGEKLIGLRFRKYSASHQSDPSIEAGDLVELTDWKGNKYRSLVTSAAFQLGGIQKTACNAESPSRNSATRYSESTKNHVALRKLIRDEASARETAINSLATALANSGGLYMTTEEMGDGSFIYYAHNKPTKEESDIVWLFTAEAFGFSMDGGETYPYGFTVTGEMVMRILQADGINADWINAGAFTIKDDDGNVIFSADKDTKKIIIRLPTDTGTLSGRIEEGAFDFTHKDAAGNATSGLTFDFATGRFIFNGSGEFHATDGSGSYIRIEDDEIVLYDNKGSDRLRIGFVSDANTEYPYVLLAKDETGVAGGLIKRFSNGVWFGNAVPKEDTGAFSGKSYASGLFVNYLENKAYIVNGTEMKNLYTGEAVARFA